MNNTKALVLHSGGLDSTTALALALVDRKPEDVSAISFDYGQLHATEISAAIDVCNHYGVVHYEVNLSQISWLFEGGALTGHEEMPHKTYEQLHESEGPSPTYVPYRNGALLSHAAQFAVRESFDYIYAGMHGEDAHGWAYPDCTPEFLGAQANAIHVGSYYKVRLVVPFQHFAKRDVVNLGLELEAPYRLTLSCYEGTRPACGKCPTCIGRLHAFTANNVVDPISYA